MVYIFSFLKKHRHCVCLNNTYSGFKDIIPGVPKGSIVDPILFNAFSNDFVFCIKQAPVYDFACNNTLSSFAKTFVELIRIQLITQKNQVHNLLTHFMMGYNKVDIESLC